MENLYFWNKKIKISYLLSIMVFWMHCSTFSNYDESGYTRLISLSFRYSINYVAVPLFLLISGALFYRDYTDSKYKYKLLKRIKSLFIPFVIWNTVNMFSDFFASAFFSQYFVGRPKSVVSFKNIFLGIFHYKYNGPFWFIFALIVFVIAAPIIDKLLYSKLTSVLSIAILIVLSCFDIGLPHPLFFDKTCIIFYMFGGFIGKFYFDIFSKPVSKKVQIISVCIVLFAFVYYLLSHYRIVKTVVGIDTVFLMLLSLCFWYAFDLFSFAPEEKKFNRVFEFEKHSFWIYALHINVSAVMTKILYIILPKYQWISVVNFILTTVLTVLFIELVCLIIKKISPRLYNLLSGSR